MAEYPIIPEKTAMVFFDALNVYLHPDDPQTLAALEKAGIIRKFQQLAAACREAGIAVFYPQADHRPDSRDFAAQIVDRGYDTDGTGGPRKTRLPAAVSGSHEAEVIPEIAPQPGDYVIKKHRWSSFFQTHLELSLRTAGIDTLILVGGATEIGIASTAYSARDLDYNLIIVSDSCTSRYEDVKDFFMERVFPAFARVMTTDQAIGAIRTAAKV